MPLIRAGKIFFPSPRNGLCTPCKPAGEWSEALTTFMEQLEAVPKFVVAPDLVDLATNENYARSILDMQRVGVLRLPYPAMVVEWSAPGYHAVVLVRDLAATNAVFPWEDGQPKVFSDYPFYGWALRIHKDEGGEYLVVAPVLNSINFVEVDGRPHINISGSIGISTTDHHVDSPPPPPQLKKLAEATGVKTGVDVYHALFVALLLMNTLGVECEVIECSRLNRQRAQSNKTPIPRHTYIYIGRVYRSASDEASDEYVPRRSPRPHWRRGHVRSVHHGIGRTGIRQVYIQPRLVAMRPEAAEPEPDPGTVTYHVRK